MSASSPVSTTSVANADAHVAPLFRWIVLFVSWAAVTLTFTDRLAWATVAVVAGQSLQIPIAALGVFITAFYVGYVISNIVGGLSTDRFGPERVMLMSLMPLGLATFCFGFTSSLAYGVALQMLMGLSAGANYSATVKLIVSWFGLSERGRAMGLLTSANSFGVLVANAVVPSLSAALDWTGAYHVLGLATSLFGLLAFLTLRNRRAPGAPPPSPRFDPFVVFRDRNLTLLAMAGFCVMWGTWGVAFWANALMTKGFGLNPVDTGSLMALFGAAGLVSKPVMGFVLDAVGASRKKTVLIVLFLGFAATLAGYSLLNDTGQLRIATPVLGLFAFVYTPVLVALVSEIAGAQRTGAAVGISNAVWQLGSVIVPVAIGVVFSATESFKVAFLTLAVGPLLAGLLTMFVSYEAEH
ncbi:MULTISPECIES: MFS transporter [Bradyrhizobium]|uniref:MFS transporter n=1 Tax=Bradyrhizobium TaxID=374 RepID=UPI00155EEEF9|nr:MULTISPECIES: MFS transporter [Bradyrhizobium]MDD1520778.1 MFS transporter [Bradyrhizobium sp. WBAH30]MDD1545829.1 MFS transporter [Bradyrhizobium sp. WBAH41]MDD1558910.1 MFS transporter [Bradyrhizobium sp. WBAH23]MDD1566440.1 MFS transporter [Bradyrhizobium sp. WBAH33]MDD1592033.1 MFS transporter [Bradyrhizobium sp. WBAH42]